MHLAIWYNFGYTTLPIAGCYGLHFVCSVHCSTNYFMSEHCWTVSVKTFKPLCWELSYITNHEYGSATLKSLCQLKSSHHELFDFLVFWYSQCYIDEMLLRWYWHNQVHYSGQVLYKFCVNEPLKCCKCAGLFVSYFWKWTFRISIPLFQSYYSPYLPTQQPPILSEDEFQNYLCIKAMNKQ